MRRSEDNFVTFDTADGEEIRVEIDRAPDSFLPIRGDRSLGQVQFLFKPVFDAVRTLIRDAREVNPDTVNVRFGIKLTAGGSAIVSQKAGEGHFDVNLTWNRESRKS